MKDPTACICMVCTARMKGLDHAIIWWLEVLLSASYVCMYVCVYAHHMKDPTACI